MNAVDKYLKVLIILKVSFLWLLSPLFFHLKILLIQRCLVSGLVGEIVSEESRFISLKKGLGDSQRITCVHYKTRIPTA